jgi:phosphotransferase system enzyme I (PtsI)
VPYKKLLGISAARGIAIGKAYIYHKEVPVLRRNRVPQHGVEAEVERFLNTLHLVGEEIHRTRRLVEQEHSSDLAQIFSAQLAMVEDVEVQKQTLQWIRERRYSAEHAFSLTLQQTKRVFAGVDNEYLRGRLSDVLDIEYQILVRLVGGELKALHSLRSSTIIVARDLLPSEVIHLDQRMVKGVVTDMGGATSHTSIIARSMGLPAVVGAVSGSKEINSGDRLIVDGNDGVIHIRPNAELLGFYRNVQRRQRQRVRDLHTRRDLPAVTLDGKQITLMANIDLPAEVQIAIDNGAVGVGMYRTEFLHLGYQLPDEEAQLAIYSQIVKALAPNPVVIRTIDVGGDKLAQAVKGGTEANPFLGWRGVRVCLDLPDLFKTQLRALLRSGTLGQVQILVPMISTIEEVQRTRALVEEVKIELKAESKPFQEEVKLGMMVEVPATVLMLDHFAKEVDFFSLGTNDLVQYALAVDRANAKVADLYDPFHPAVLQLIRMVAECGQRNDLPVSICGEMAGDPLATLLLLGLGLEVLSLSPGLIPEVKEVVHSVRLSEARCLAERCLAASTGKEVRRHLEDAAQ